jgi:hypothetical protein
VSLLFIISSKLRFGLDYLLAKIPDDSACLNLEDRGITAASVKAEDCREGVVISIRGGERSLGCHRDIK